MVKNYQPVFCPIGCKYAKLFTTQTVNGDTIYKCKNADICKHAYKLGKDRRNQWK